MSGVKERSGVGSSHQTHRCAASRLGREEQQQSLGRERLLRHDRPDRVGEALTRKETAHLSLEIGLELTPLGCVLSFVVVGIEKKGALDARNGPVRLKD